MTQMIDDMVERIVSIPADFSKASASFSLLLKESGYLESPRGITVEQIEGALRKSPEHIESWFQWSEDKRTESGWFLLHEGARKFVVGYYPASHRIGTTVYTDKYVATANFIKREIEDIRGPTQDTQ